MPFHAGIDLGTTFTAAALARNGRVEMVTLGNQAVSIPSIVYVDRDGGFTAGDPARRRLLTEPHRVAVGFKRRMGDPAPLVLGGSPYPAHLVSSRLLRTVVHTLTEREGESPERVTVTHPANWGPFKREYLDQAILGAGLNDARTLSEPEAAAIAYAESERVEPGALVAVYDLGGGTFDAALLRRTDEGFEFLGRPAGVEQLGGLDFDDVVYRFVLEQLDLDPADLDANDTDVVTSLQRLHDDCVDAKIALSTDTETVVAISLPEQRTQVRVTRAEFEDRIRPLLVETIDALRRALESADIEADQLDRVLLVGGSSRIPLVGQMVTEALGRPVALDADPKNAIAKGAAIDAAGSLTSPTTAPSTVGEDEDSKNLLPNAAAEAAPLLHTQPDVDRFDEPDSAGVGRPGSRRWIERTSLFGIAVALIGHLLPWAAFSGTDERVNILDGGHAGADVTISIAVLATLIPLLAFITTRQPDPRPTALLAIVGVTAFGFRLAALFSIQLSSFSDLKVGMFAEIAAVALGAIAAIAAFARPDSSAANQS